MEIGWNTIKDKFQKRPMAVNYVMRTILVTAAVLLAVAVPTISPFIGLIGAFCFSILGLLIPVFIEMITFWYKYLTIYFKINLTHNYHLNSFVSGMKDLANIIGLSGKIWLFVFLE